VMLSVELRSPRLSLPRVAYVASVATIVLLGFLHPFLFLVLWSVQHWSAAMGLASLAAAGERQETGAHWQRLLAPINRRGWSDLPTSRSAPRSITSCQTPDTGRRVARRVFATGSCSCRPSSAPARPRDSRRRPGTRPTRWPLRGSCSAR